MKQCRNKQRRTRAYASMDSTDRTFVEEQIQRQAQNTTSRVHPASEKSKKSIYFQNSSVK